MSSRATVLPLGFGLSAVLCFSSGGSAAEEPEKQAAPAPVRVYTNEDLARVHPFRSQTGVDSLSAMPTADTPPAATAGATGRRGGAARDSDRSGARANRSATREKGEEYWRHEAQRFRERMRSLVDQRETLRARIAAREEDQRLAGLHGRRRSSSGSSTRSTTAGGSGDSTALLRARLAAVERRMRELEEELADRARREGALPGWLR